jgi:hypothetical protein
MHLTLIKGDNLPKRSACQIINFKFKNLNLIAKLVFKENKKKIFVKKSLYSKIEVFFSITTFKTNCLKKKARISIAFSSKIQKKNILLIVQNSNLKQKKNYFDLKKINSIGLILTKKIFFKKYSEIYFQNQIINDYNFLFIDEPLKFQDNILILKLIKNFKISVSQFKFKKNLTRSIMGSCASMWVNLPSGSSFFIKINRWLCFNKLIGNILQIIGSVFDILPGGYKNNRKLGIKYIDSLLYL